MNIQSIQLLSLETFGNNLVRTWQYQQSRPVISFVLNDFSRKSILKHTFWMRNCSWSYYSKMVNSILKGTFLQKMNVNLKDICVSLENKEPTSQEKLEERTKLRQLNTYYIILSNWHSDIENYHWLHSQAKWMRIKRNWVNILKISNNICLDCFKITFSRKLSKSKLIVYKNVSTELVALICQVFLSCSVWYKYIIRKNV